MAISQLQKIQATTQQIAEVISSVLGIDVTIFDEQMVRIAGTGHHRDTVGQKICAKIIYSRHDRAVRTSCRYLGFQPCY